MRPDECGGATMRYGRTRKEPRRGSNCIRAGNWNAHGIRLANASNVTACPLRLLGRADHRPTDWMTDPW
jgi:hypothetical protein